jgi:hypothetical protein
MLGGETVISDRCSLELLILNTVLLTHCTLLPLFHRQQQHGGCLPYLPAGYSQYPTESPVSSPSHRYSPSPARTVVFTTTASTSSSDQGIIAPYADSH